MTIIFAFILAAFYSTIALGQSLLSVPVTIGDLQYEVELIPTMEGVRDMAKRFCRERHNDFNVEMDGNFQSNCITPVAEYLADAIEKTNRQLQERERAALAASTKAETIRVPLKIADNEYEITFPATEVHARHMAGLFCTERGPSIGVTAANYVDSCLRPIGDYLKDAVRKRVGAPSSTQSEIKVSMRVGSQIYDFSWNPAVKSVKDMSVQFCVEHGASFGVKQSNMDSNCVDPVYRYLQEAVESQNAGEAPVAPAPSSPKDELITANIQIDETTFQFKFNPTVQSAKATAVKFCYTYGDRLGLTRENLDTGCIAVILQTLINVVTKDPKVSQ